MRKTQFNNKAILLLTISTLLISLNSIAQVKKGNTIFGEAAHDNSGFSVSMPDANTIAIGAYYNEGTGQDAGHVRVYTWNGKAWAQKGIDIDGEEPNDILGCSISMPDANTIGIGAFGSDATAIDAGQVKVYTWNGANWLQKGSGINGESANDASGFSVCMPDANTIAISAPFNDGNADNAGHVRVYSWNGINWIQKGADINGEAADDWSGYSISMPNENTISIGAHFNGRSGETAGHTRVYIWSGSAWIQKGNDLVGEATNDQSGYSVSMPDPNTVAIGAPYNDGYATDAGHTRVYKWNGSAWTQKGYDIEGEAVNDQAGHSVIMPDSNTIAIGAYLNDGNTTDAGHVRIYTWNGSAWIQLGSDIDGETADEWSGWSVSMPDANTIAIGVQNNDENGMDAGCVRAYTLNNTNKLENSFGYGFKVFPNPVLDKVNIEFGEIHQDITIIFRTLQGEEVMRNSFIDTKSLYFNIPFAVGLYLMEISSDNNKTLYKIMKM